MVYTRNHQIILRPYLCSLYIFNSIDISSPEIPKTPGNLVNFMQPIFYYCSA